MTMSATASASAPAARAQTYSAQREGWFARMEAWLDARGRGAWIAAMVFGFILFWPVGLALLFYILWSNRMTCTSRRVATPGLARTGRGSSGNAAFDQYKADTLRRLEDEQQAFEEFLKRLREAKDKSEFDQFLDERSRMDDSGADTGDSDGSESDAGDPRPAS